MDKLISVSGGSTIAKTQLRAIEDAERILEKVLEVGVSRADVEYREELCYDIEGLMDYYSPGILKNFRFLFTILYYAEEPAKYPEILAHMNYLVVLSDRAKKYLQRRLDGMEPDMTTTIESHIGYLWRRADLLSYKLYEENAEIIQLSFHNMKDEVKGVYVDLAHWINLKTGDIYYTRRIRPVSAEKFIKKDNSEFEVFGIDRLFIYPGEINKRIRWEKKLKREITPADLYTLLKYAKTDYTEIVNTLKASFADPLAEQSPVTLVKLNKIFINGDHLVLEDKQGGLLTLADSVDDDAPTTELLRMILPSEPVDSALLVQVNHDVMSDLFSVKPLSIITSSKIIRLLY